MMERHFVMHQVCKEHALTGLQFYDSTPLWQTFHIGVGVRNQETNLLLSTAANLKPTT